MASHSRAASATATAWDENSAAKVAAKRAKPLGAWMDLPSHCGAPSSPGILDPGQNACRGPGRDSHWGCEGEPKAALHKAAPAGGRAHASKTLAPLPAFQVTPRGLQKTLMTRPAVYRCSSKHLRFTANGASALGLTRASWSRGKMVKPAPMYCVSICQGTPLHKHRRHEMNFPNPCFVFQESIRAPLLRALIA